MHILITYENGRTETVAARLEAHAFGRNRHGIRVDDALGCPFWGDDFEKMIRDSKMRGGTCRPTEADIDPDTGKTDWLAFRWELVGTERQECLAKVIFWGDLLGDILSPESAITVLPEERRERYRDDMALCLAYLDEHPLGAWRRIQDEETRFELDAAMDNLREKHARMVEVTNRVLGRDGSPGTGMRA